MIGHELIIQGRQREAQQAAADTGWAAKPARSAGTGPRVLLTAPCGGSCARTLPGHSDRPQSQSAAGVLAGVTRLRSRPAPGPGGG